MSIFLQYAYLDTPIHRLNVITKTIMLFTFLMLLLIWMDYRLMIFLDAAILLTYFLAKVPKSWLRIVLVILVIPVPFTLFISTFLYSPSLFKVYSYEVVSREFFRVNVPYLGKLSLNYGSLLWSIAMINRFMALPVFFMYMYTTSVSEIVDLLRLLRLPAGIVHSVAVAFKLIPQFVDSFSTTISAQKLRGWDISTIKNPLKKARKVGPVLVPMLRTATTVADEVSLAAEIRAFGIHRPTITTEFKFTKSDYAVSILCLIILGTAVYAFVTLKVGLI